VVVEGQRRLTSRMGCAHNTLNPQRVPTPPSSPHAARSAPMGLQAAALAGQLSAAEPPLTRLLAAMRGALGGAAATAPHAPPASPLQAHPHEPQSQSQSQQVTAEPVTSSPGSSSGAAGGWGEGGTGAWAGLGGGGAGLSGSLRLLEVRVRAEPHHTHPHAASEATVAGLCTLSTSLDLLRPSVVCLARQELAGLLLDELARRGEAAAAADAPLAAARVALVAAEEEGARLRAQLRWRGRRNGRTASPPPALVWQ
jgi:hypothetical protein